MLILDYEKVKEVYNDKEAVNDLFDILNDMISKRKEGITHAFNIVFYDGNSMSKSSTHISIFDKGVDLVFLAYQKKLPSQQKLLLIYAMFKFEYDKDKIRIVRNLAWFDRVRANNFKNQIKTIDIIDTDTIPSEQTGFHRGLITEEQFKQKILNRILNLKKSYGN